MLDQEFTLITKAEVPPEVWSEFEESLDQDIEAWTSGVKAFVDEYDADLEVGKSEHGVMIGYFLPPDIAKELAFPDGEKPEELHFTIGYFGKNLTDAQIEALKKTTEN